MTETAGSLEQSYNTCMVGVTGGRSKEGVVGGGRERERKGEGEQANKHLETSI